jgi:rsbT co-antagonist protein RsbR
MSDAAAERIALLEAQIAALEQLLAVQEATSLEQAASLEQAIQERTASEVALREERNALQQLVEQQEQLIETIRALSAPLLPLDEGVLVLPLVGHIDARRSTQITEALLEGIHLHQADRVIIDVTGVPLIDTGVANHLLQTTRAAQLLGAECILVGIGAELAQTIVQLGVDLTRLVIRADLRSGVTYATKRRSRSVGDAP